ncbi:enoyl-CoA hydratase/isomerase family protein [Noviherbaspirillum denitrificans]|uniref:Enoyl-CoA hydratase n=1 Tax=Noviherbaspirillum denitrificans TaxID=1968433 RepID=A0A254TAL5_9BURK|nr:enoyl-CoA hydratase/isomerase family protein [Noviherbaspirillum denitrificans]OWW19605.1 enoyl-CoA hydratase [Noviherbaspirillum denitrificans]
MNYVKFDREGDIGVITLNRPERLNAIGAELLDDFHAVLREAQSDPALKVLVLTGAGRAFCAGDDLKDFARQTESPASIRHHVERIQQISRDLMFGEKPVVGAIHGYAVGGGFEWLLNCDVVVASDDLCCFFPEMDWGQFVTGGVTHLLPQAVGYQKAMELWLLGEKQDSRALLDLRLVNWVVPRGEMMQKAMDVAAVIASKSAFSVARLKTLLTTQLQTRIATALELEQAATIACFGTDEAAARIKKFG